ncbi:GIY-YIG nuclease family protein [Shewanella basaltis]|uniref:GIY-YIG nuclease family protein n=1 Tax=Shewanella basaltis TaxID=472183 RepID=UPI00200CB24B|nr:GIY-YIG nuclease family protein [Shewanella basaltis]MCL1115574.1 GIY-YIG nuclease family protein [Shewanella basaltis]
MNIKCVIEAITVFDLNFKRPGIDCLKECFSSIDITEQNWASLWAEGGYLRELTNEPCVYFFFDGVGELKYIGKAEVLGYRFGAHFSKGSKWSGLIKTIGILAVPKESWFEIVAIEAYLIDFLKPSENKLGKTSRRI